MSFPQLREICVEKSIIRREAQRSFCWHLMKKFLVPLFILVCAGGAWLAVAASRYEEKVRPGSSFEGSDIGGLTRAEATRRVQDWWKTQRDLTVTFNYPGMKPIQRPLSLCGLILDVEPSVAQLPFDSFWANAIRPVAAPEPKEYKAVYLRISPREWSDVRGALKAIGREGTSTEAGPVLDQPKMNELAYEAALKRGSVEVPVLRAPAKP